MKLHIDEPEISSGTVPGLPEPTERSRDLTQKRHEMREIIP